MKTKTATATNVYVLAANVTADGSIPGRLRATDVPHIKRCMAAGLLGSDLQITKSGIEVIRKDSWHQTNAAAIARMGV